MYDCQLLGCRNIVMKFGEEISPDYCHSQSENCGRCADAVGTSLWSCFVTVLHLLRDVKAKGEVSNLLSFFDKWTRVKDSFWLCEWLQFVGLHLIREIGMFVKYIDYHNAVLMLSVTAVEQLINCMCFICFVTSSSQCY